LSPSFGTIILGDIIAEVVAGFMAWMMFLDVARNPKSGWDDKAMRRGLTLSKRGAHIADLMLFDRSSLAEAHNGRKTYRILLSERTRAIERFRRRLPSVLTALAWHPVAVDTLPRFGKFFERIDWPYVLLKTDEYRMNISDPQYYMTSDEFDRILEFAVSADDGGCWQSIWWRRPLFTDVGEVAGILIFPSQVDLCR
jgi:hypothetical protein